MEGDQKKAAFGLGGAGAGAVVGAVLITNPVIKGALIALAVILLLGVATLLVLVVLKHRKAKQKEQSLNNLIDQSEAQSSSRELSKEEAEALTHDVEAQMHEGRDILRKSKLNIYEIPWYLVMGEPKAGKTCACEALFKQLPHPPGITNALQGKGGTLNMDWWFYEDVVLLDTAGRLVFEHTPEWDTLLKGLNHIRPACPVNGVILVIPADSLLNDDYSAIKEKAGRLRAQLFKTKEVLDLRFPVYVFVTKADFLPGFREFAVQLNTQDSTQIFGWSSQVNDLDAAFDPADAQQGLDQFIAAVRQRCMSVVAQVDNNAGLVGRISQVDELFALPSSFKAKAWKNAEIESEGQEWRPPSSLALYLYEIFRGSAGQGQSRSRYKTKADTKQLFVRGVYFTSSMQQGPVYDPETARRFGVSKERPKSTGAAAKVYFLRDLLLRKILPEHGLVTPLENIKQARRKQAAVVMGAACLALLVLVTFIFLGRSKLRHSVEGDVAYWNEAQSSAHRHDQGAEWLAARDYVLPDENKKTDRLDFHHRLFERTRHPLSVPFPYNLFVHLSDESARKEAQWRLFTNDFLVPFLEKVRAKMQNPPNVEGEAMRAQMTRLQSALIAQVQLEADIASKNASSDHANALLKSGVELLSATDNFTNRDFTDTFLKTLFDNRYAPQSWPLPELSRGGDYAKNAPINGCVNWLVNAANSQNQTYSTNFNALSDLQTALGDFQRKEIALSNVLSNESYRADQAKSAVESLADSADRINQKLSALSMSGNLWTSYSNLLTEVESTSSNRFAEVVKQLPPNCPGTFSNDIAQALLNMQSSLRSSVGDKLTDAATRALDDEMLRSSESGKGPDFAARVQYYQDMMKRGDQCQWQIGVDWKPWKELSSDLDTLRGAAKAYHGGALSRFQVIENGLKKESALLAATKVQAQYVQLARQRIDKVGQMGSPATEPQEWVKQFGTNLEAALNLERDAKSLPLVSSNLLQSDAEDLTRVYADCTRAVDLVLTKCPAQLKGILIRSLSFPLVAASTSKPMEPDDLRGTKAIIDLLKGTSADSPMVFRDKRCASAIQAANDLFLADLEHKLNSLSPPAFTPNCEIAVLTEVRPGKPADLAQSVLRNAQIKQEDNPNAHLCRIDSKTVNVVGTVALSKPFSIEFTADPPATNKLTLDFPAWELLRRNGVELERAVPVRGNPYNLRLKAQLDGTPLQGYTPPF